MDDVSRRFYDALLQAFPGYARSRADTTALDDSILDAAVASGEQILESGLTRLFSTPAAAQRATPLQVFRAALEPLQQAMGVESDAEGGFSPASAAEISQEALEASLVWGASKAKAMSRPVMAVVTENLMDLGPFEAAAERTGYRVERVGGGDAADLEPVVAFVDLEIEGADAAVALLAEAGVRTIAYGPHVDSFALTRAKALGAVAAEPRSRVLRDPSVYVSPVV